MLLLEELSMNAWPALQTNLYDGWVIRFTNGYSKRANSINPIYFSNENIYHKITLCEEMFKQKSIMTVFKITPKIFPHNLDSLLDKQGYKIRDITSLQVLELDNINTNIDVNLRVSEELSQEWLEDYFQLNGVGIKNKITIEKMLRNISSKKYFITLVHNNKAIACALGVLEREHLGIFDVIVNEEFRSNGYGEKLIKGLINLGKNNGAKKAYLQVVINNIKAFNLYSKIGFKEAYKYWYRVK